jgi:thiol-disulfide isomerase/thioredoxin
MAHMLLRSVAMLALFVFADGRLGSGIYELTSANFDVFFRNHPNSMIDFMDSSSKEYQEDSKSLIQAIRAVRDNGLNTAVARVDFAKEPDLVKRFLEVGCSDQSESQLCGAKLPQVVWFRDAEATPYRRYLHGPVNIFSHPQFMEMEAAMETKAERSTMHIATFIYLMDRPPLMTIDAVPDEFEFSQVVLAKMPANSPELKELAAAATRFMDSVSFLHIESSERNITWVANGTLIDYFTEPVDAAGFTHWVQVHVAQSDDVPENAMDAGSVVVVGKTFDEIVIRDDKDVMLLAYAPWCGFSRKAMPAWADFAHRSVGSKLVVAKMDATRNRSPMPGCSLTTYPSIIYVRKGEHMAIPFEGANRTVEAFMEFAKSHSSEPLHFESDEAIMLQNQATEIEL